MVTVEVIETQDAWQHFVAEWSDFLSKVPPATPFQTPQWLLAWWIHFGNGKLHVLVFRDGTETVGILPCFVHEWNSRRQMTLVGTGISDYLDPVFDPRLLGAIGDALAEHLFKNTEWEVCDWQDLTADTPLGTLQTITVNEDTPCMRTPLGTSYERFMTNRSHGLKRNLRRYRQKLEAMGRLRFTVSNSANESQIAALVCLHTARRQRSGEPGMIALNRAEAFLFDVAPSLAASDMLRVFMLYLEKRVIGVILALRNPTTVFSYLSAFDPEYETFGCGRELLARALEYAHAERYKYWNFLRGDEPYKLTWDAEPIRKCRLILDRSPGGSDSALADLIALK